MGKHALISLVLLVSLSLSPVWTTAARYSDNNAVVRDTEGNPLELGSEYIIQVVENGWYGPSLGRVSRPNSSQPCPLYAAISPTRDAVGRPVKFTPVDGDTKIRVSGPIQIDSGSSGYCRSDGIWRVVSNRRTMIAASKGPVQEWPATFSIQLGPVTGPLRFAYKLTLVGSQDRDVTVFEDNKVMFLGLVTESDPPTEPLYVLFVKNRRIHHVGEDVALH